MTEPSQVERTYLEIRNRIVEGRYRPGMHLSESMLARLHRSSRTPVREALARLLQEGYVEHVPTRGHVVTQITLTVIQNMFQVRRLLESAAAAQAAASATAQDVQRLRELEDCGYIQARPQSYYDALAKNRQFHLTVAETSRNVMLVDLIRQLLTQMDRALSLGINYQPFQDWNAIEHHRIVDSIASRKAAQARRAMDRHLEHSYQLLMEALMRGDSRSVTL